MKLLNVLHNSMTAFYKIYQGNLFDSYHSWRFRIFGCIFIPNAESEKPDQFLSCVILTHTAALWTDRDINVADTERGISHPTGASWRACCAPTGCWRFPSGICHRGGGCASPSRHRQSRRSHYRGQQIDPGHPWPHWPLWCTALWGTGPDELQEK